MTQGRGLGPKRRWTAEEDALVKSGAKNIPDRTYAAIRVRRRTLGVAGKPFEGRAWTVEEDNYLLNNYLKLTHKKMASDLNRTVNSIHNRVRVIGAEGGRTQKDWALKGADNPRWQGGSRSRQIVKAYQARRRAKSEMNMSEEDIEISIAYRQAILKDSCFYCGNKEEKMQTDHFFAIAKGGSDHWWNLVRSCASCNHKKSTRCGTKFKLLGV